MAASVNMEGLRQAIGEAASAILNMNSAVGNPQPAGCTTPQKGFLSGLFTGTSNKTTSGGAKTRRHRHRRRQTRRR